MSNLTGSKPFPETPGDAADFEPRGGGIIGFAAMTFQKVESGSKEEQEAQQLTAAVEALARVLAAVLQRGEDRS